MAQNVEALSGTAIISIEVCRPTAPPARRSFLLVVQFENEEPHNDNASLAQAAHRYLSRIYPLLNQPEKAKAARDMVTRISLINAPQPVVD